MREFCSNPRTGRFKKINGCRTSLWPIMTFAGRYRVTWRKIFTISDGWTFISSAFPPGRRAESMAFRAEVKPFENGALRSAWNKKLFDSRFFLCPIPFAPLPFAPCFRPMPHALRPVPYALLYFAIALPNPGIAFLIMLSSTQNAMRK